MLVKRLKEILDSLPDDYVVVLSSDEEGNCYSPVGGWDTALYQETGRGGEIFMEEDFGPGDKENCVVFWPI